MAKLELNGKEFNSSTGELTFGDLEFLEQEGIDMGSFKEGVELPITTMRKVAFICLKKSDPSIDVDFMKSIPARKMKELAEFVNAFFTENSLTENASS